MSLTIQDFRAGAFLRGRCAGHSAAWAQHAPACLDAILAQLLRSPFLGLLRLAFHSSQLETNAVQRPIEVLFNYS